MPISHSTVVVVADDGTSPVGTDEWNAALVGSPDLPSTLYDPNLDETLAANATAIFDTDPLILDSGRLLTIPSNSILWMNAPRSAPLARVQKVYNVLDYGADATGAGDSTGAILAAVTAAATKGIVYFPVGNYKVSATIPLDGCDVIGEALGNGLGVKIQPVDQTFAIFTNSAQRDRWRISNLMLDFSTANASTTCTNTAAVGISLTAASGQFYIENVFVQYAYYGVNDTGGAYLLTYRNCQFDRCQVGFLKSTGTTLTMIGCYFTNCIKQALNIDSCMNTTFIDCSSNVCNNGANNNHVHVFHLCHGLTIQGFNMEANNATGQAGLISLINISRCLGFTVMGLKSANNVLVTTGSNTVAYMLIDLGSVGRIVGSTWGTDWNDATTVAGGTGYSLYIDGSTIACQVTLSESEVKNTTSGAGSPTVVNILVSNHAGQVVVLENSLTSGTITDAGNRILYLPNLDGGVTLAAGSTTVAPLKLVSGTNLTTPLAGAIEFDGAAFYKTADTTTGRGFDDRWHYFRLTANGAGITTIADFFGTNDGIPTVLNGVYEVEWYCYWVHTTTGTGTITWTIVNTQTVTNMVADYIQCPVGGIGTVGAPQTAAVVAQTAASVALPVTGANTAIASHYAIVHAVIEAATAGNVRLRMTASAGTATPSRDSFFRVRRLPAGNAGTYVA